MSKNRKTDEQRLKEGRGTGRGIGYTSWLKVHEFGSKGRAHRILGWKKRRIYQLMSDLELYYFLTIQMDDNVIDIREQFPLLPLEETELIAEEENIIHPPKNRKKKTIITTDFVITVKEGNLVRDIAVAIKYDNDLNKHRTKEKLRLEELYWKKKDVSWQLVTDKKISKIVGRNIYYIYNSFFWGEKKGLSLEELRRLTHKFLDRLAKNNFNILHTTNDFDFENCWEMGESLNFFKFLLTRKVITTDFNKRFNYHTMNITVNDEKKWKLE